MKNLLKMLMFSLLLLLLGGCLSSEDSVVGVEDPSTGETLYVRVLEYDLASGMGSVEDTATGEVYSGEVVFYDKESITVVEDGDTLSFNIVSGAKSADSLATETPSTIRDTITDSLDTVKDSTLADTVTLVDTLTTSDPWPYPWEDGQYVYWDSSSTSFYETFRKAGFTEYIENPYSDMPSWVPTFSGKVERNVRVYSHAKGKAYVVEDRLMFLIPDRDLVLLTPQVFSGNPEVDSILTVRQDILSTREGVSQRLALPTDSLDIMFYTYGAARDPSLAFTSSWDNLGGSQNRIQQTCKADSDQDGLYQQFDPGCSAVYEGSNLPSINIDWFAYLQRFPDAALALPLILEVFSISLDQDIPLAFVNNPFEWATFYQAHYMGRNTGIVYD
jgi:hypothetical protein